MATVEIKAFLPAKDYELSQRFYVDLGFTIPWASEDLAYLCAGKCSFLLSKFYRKEFAENLMMHLLVEDVDAWWQQADTRQLSAKYGVNVGLPENRPWGIRDFTVNDPAGVLWRIGQEIKAAE
ncbi:MAG TPA: VOC family protein [Burkholderiales bacterium]|nr:VOC family protein [Burkholderiales bacterium]